MTHTNRRYALKHSGYDHHTPGNRHRSKNRSKKDGFGTFNWGRPGDEMGVTVLDKGDPMYDEDADTDRHHKSPTSSSLGPDLTAEQPPASRERSDSCKLRMIPAK